MAKWSFDGTSGKERMRIASEVARRSVRGAEDRKRIAGGRRLEQVSAELARAQERSAELTAAAKEVLTCCSARPQESRVAARVAKMVEASASSECASARC